MIWKSGLLFMRCARTNDFSLGVREKERKQREIEEGRGRERQRGGIKRCCDVEEAYFAAKV